MRFFYNLLVCSVQRILPLIALVNHKLKLFVVGRKNTWNILAEHFPNKSNCIWFHVASLGEYEQALPLMKAIKEKNPKLFILLTFFSPSGFEVQKNNKVASLTMYLPLDTPSNAKKFIETIKPKMVFFVKYEFWPNYLNQLCQKKIPTYLVSGIFRENQLFFAWYGKFFKQSLKAFHYFFVQNKISETLLNSIGFLNVQITGDTRFDRVIENFEKSEILFSIEAFKNNHFTVVVGSSWLEDENVYLPVLNATENIKWIIAPHNIKDEEIKSLKNKINKKTILFSQDNPRELTEAEVFIIDTIGLLNKIYKYADVAYVGGAFKTGLHNILEPAVFGIPILIGPKFQKFQEAKDLVGLKSCISVTSTNEFKEQLNQLHASEKHRARLGSINQKYVLENKEATLKIVNHLKL